MNRPNTAETKNTTTKQACYQIAHGDWQSQQH